MIAWQYLRSRNAYVNMQDTFEAESLNPDDMGQLSVPTPLERFAQAASVLDGHTHFYMWILAISRINAIMTERDKVRPTAAFEASRKSCDECCKIYGVAYKNVILSLFFYLLQQSTSCILHTGIAKRLWLLENYPAKLFLI